MELEQKINLKIQNIEKKAQEEIKKSEEEDKEKIEQFNLNLQNCKNTWEINELIGDVGYSFESKVLESKKTKETLLKILIENYPLSKEIKNDSEHEIVSLSFSVFETSFDSIVCRLNLDKDKDLLKRACVGVLKRAEKEEDINIIIPLKKFLNIDNKEEVDKKLIFLEGAKIDNRGFVYNSSNIIYYYEELLKWVSNEEQRKKIREKIVYISNKSIENDSKSIQESERDIRKLKIKIKEEKKNHPILLKELTEKNNKKISKLKDSIKDNEKVVNPLRKKIETIDKKIDKLGYWDFDWTYRNQLDKGEIKEILKVKKDEKKSINLLVDTLKEKKKLENQAQPFDNVVEELRGEISSLEVEIRNKEYDFKRFLEEKNKEIEEKGWNIYQFSSSILDSLLKINEQGKIICDSDLDYYKYLEIVLDKTERSDDIDLVKKVLPIIKTIKI